MFRAKVYISLHDNILDPQGKALLEAIGHLDFKDITDARVGKFICLDINEKDKKEADSTTKEICNKLLHNPIIESYTYELVEQTEGNV